MQTNKQTNKFSQGLKLVALFAMVLSVVCCSKKNVDERVNVPESAKNFVSADDARSLLSQVGTLTKSGDNSKFAEIETVTQVGDAEGNAVFYAVNYQDGGFILLSADNRIEPVLAFSETNTFSVEAIPETGMLGWISIKINNVDEMRMVNPLQTDEQKIMWKPVNIARLLADVDTVDNPYTDEHCEWWQEVISVAPITTAKWNKSYSTTPPYKLLHSATVAIGQLMQHYKFPDNYDWNNMPNNLFTPTIDVFLKSIQTQLNAYYDKTNSAIPAIDIEHIPIVFRNNGYHDAKFASYNKNVVIDQISRGYPVVLSNQKNVEITYSISTDPYTGKVTKTIQTVEQPGGTWICDGLYIHNGCSYETMGSEGVMHHLAGTFKYSINWGNEGLNNGFYDANSMLSHVWPNSDIYMIYDIIK